MDAADVDIEVDLLSEPLVAEVAGEGPLLVVHQTLVLVQHRLRMGNMKIFSCKRNEKEM